MFKCFNFFFTHSGINTKNKFIMLHNTKNFKMAGSTFDQMHELEQWFSKAGRDPKVGRKPLPDQYLSTEKA